MEENLRIRLRAREDRSREMPDLVFELFPAASGEMETLDDRLVAKYLVV